MNNFPNSAAVIPVSASLAGRAAHARPATLPMTQRAGSGAFADRDGSVTMAATLLRIRAARENIMPGMGEVAWTILLDLQLASERGAGVTVTDAAVGSFAPYTTALRHIDTLTGAGLIERHSDRDDGRRIWLLLTDQGREQLATIATRMAA